VLSSGLRAHVLYLQVLRFSFWGSGAPNYGKELLEVACRFMFEYPKELQTAILNNYMVNPSGLSGHWQEGDFFQEHSNKAIKTIFNTKNSDWDSRFLREDVSPNIAGLSQLRQSMMALLGLSRTGNGRTQADYRADINVLASHYLREGAFEYRPGRVQACLATDMVSAGFDRLKSSVLDNFLERTTFGRTVPNTQDPLPKEDEESIEIPLGPLIMENGRLVMEEVVLDSEDDDS
jgi:hypothetical protein